MFKFSQTFSIRSVLLSLKKCQQKRKYGRSFYDTGLKPLTYTTESVGDPSSIDYRLFVKNRDSASPDSFISFWHDIPFAADHPSLHGDLLLNMVTEIPKGARAKLEMSKSEPYNPICHTINENKQIHTIKHSPVLYNYGFIPRTWEDPSVASFDNKYYGDDDPLDVIDIGYKFKPPGLVYRVKLLGSLALIDQGEIDWKLITISIDDPLCTRINTVEDIETFKPGITATLKDWYQNYKVVEGKNVNAFELGGVVKDREFTFKIIQQAHENWKKLNKN
ncbi:uncharacterized protein LOC126322619 [Schistocerca gregaria]|uniref:uncharacterized protein LOC126322619 n=1 Tax=Schistocerca gregaria TaxID=7010 RepID=UPI00211F2CCA|nr:uncharacterized protein LOC126322619 [Schistocerca gregaria]